MFMKLESFKSEEVNFKFTWQSVIYNLYLKNYPIENFAFHGDTLNAPKQF